MLSGEGQMMVGRWDHGGAGVMGNWVIVGRGNQPCEVATG